MLQKARPRPDFRYTDFLVSASAHKKKRNDDLNFPRTRRKKKTQECVLGTRCLKKKREKKKKMINKEDFLNPKSISKLFSGTPQYVGPQGELLGCFGARNIRVAPWIFGPGGIFRLRAIFLPRAEGTFRTFHIDPTWNQ